LIEALAHGGIANDLKVEIIWIDSEDFEKGKKPLNFLKEMDGILVPGGFGERGKEGKIKAIKFVRENKIPFFGICLGLQTAIIEFARNVAGLSGADSTEFNECAPHKVIIKLPELLKVDDLGGTMRLGSYDCIIKDNSLAFKIYGKKEISERHRHRYEVNTQYKEKLEKAGLVFSGESPDKVYIEIIELKDHPFFIAVQFHPEFKSKPLNPHPIFKSFIEASYLNKKGKADGK
jgi:CTP synthase